MKPVTIRSVRPEDRDQIEQLLLREHGPGKPASFFYEPGTISLAAQDETGVVFYFRLTPVLRVDVQFQHELRGTKTARALRAAVAWARQFCLKGGVREMYFEAQPGPLVPFMERLGWRMKRRVLTLTIKGE